MTQCVLNVTTVCVLNDGNTWKNATNFRCVSMGKMLDPTSMILLGCEPLRNGLTVDRNPSNAWGCNDTDAVPELDSMEAKLEHCIIVIYFGRFVFCENRSLHKSAASS